jgi:hypothetical protein
MGLAITAREVPLRAATGAYILNAGLEKRHADEETAAGLHGFASGTYPFFKDLEPAAFVRLLSTAEIGIGATLLIPLIPTAVAGAALTAFSAGLVTLYLRTPGMRKKGSLAPTPQGLTISKDIWLLGIGLGLLADAATRGDSKKGKKKK